MKLFTIHIANIQMQGKWQLHHSLQISRRGRPWLSLASWLVPDSPSYVLMVLAGRVQIFYIDINKCLDFSSSTVMWVSDLFNQFSISLKTLMISFFLTLCYYFSLLSLTCLHALNQWEFRVSQKRQVGPLSSTKSLWFCLRCTNSIEVTGVTD